MKCIDDPLHGTFDLRVEIIIIINQLNRCIMIGPDLFFILLGDLVFAFAADMRDVKSRMLFDKKVTGSDVMLVLLKGVGEPAVEKAPISKVWKLLK